MLRGFVIQSAMARGMASRLTLSMVPVEKVPLGRDGLTGATYSGD